MSGPFAGINFTETWAAGTRGVEWQPFRLGTHMWSEDGKCYVYCQADGAITANDVVIMTEAYQADQIDTTNSNGAIGDRVGIAPATFADDEYGWIQVFGPATANVGSSASANTKLNTTGTAGRIDDDATAGAETILGLVTTAAESGNEAAAMMTWPFIDATL